MSLSCWVDAARAAAISAAEARAAPPRLPGAEATTSTSALPSPSRQPPARSPTTIFRSSAQPRALATLACHGRVFRRIIELRQELDWRDILPLPAYGSPDCLIERNRLLISQFLADPR